MSNIRVDKTDKDRFVCIHGHFYQPPRENPWLDEVERELSAAPFHDWNERILQECYRSNMAARIVDSQNRILQMCNNFNFLSFNFGPTLLRWIERRAPAVYEAILNADRESCKRFGGHGNAFAQVYNHIIMPLASRRDKVTQVRWGVRDFEKRFGRRPEGIWLAETAVDRETLEILAEEGIRFTVLSPFQAARWRFIKPEEGQWRDASGGEIPTGRPYRFQCSGSRHVDLFFYDQSLAHGIAFERLLEHSGKVIERIDAVHAGRPAGEAGIREPWLVHSATDGESYGHHFKFGDMALAAAFRELTRDPHTHIINYSAFLAQFPPVAEVEILENTAWSCAHGIGRWQDDCGCNVGAQPGWNQKWRRPLRDSLNRLRDLLAVHYEREMGRLAKDPWKVRDDYVNVIPDTGRIRTDFARVQTGRDLGAPELNRFYQLLEMQRCAMAMFTSCGWFFNEISELEAVLVLSYAARAIQLAEESGAPSPEPEFLQILQKAPCNVAEFANGADVYLKKVKPRVVSTDRVAVAYVLRSFVEPSAASPRLYFYHVSHRQQEDLGASPIPCRYGRIAVRDERTLDQKEFLYALLHFGGFDFRCSVKPFETSAEYDSILKALRQSVEEQNTVQIIRILDQSFGKSAFSLHDVFRDMRSSIALRMTQGPMKLFSDFQRHLYEDHRSLMRSLNRWGIELPDDMRVLVKRVLSHEVQLLVKEMVEHEQQPASRDSLGEEADFFHRAHMGRLRSLLMEAHTWKAAIISADTAEMLGIAMLDILEGLYESFAPQSAARILRLIEICRLLEIRPHLWEMQTQYYKLAGKGMKDREYASRLHNCEGLFVNQLDDFLHCRFAELLGKSPEDVGCWLPDA